MVNGKRMILTSKYLNEIRREYALYVVESRSVPHISDGLKASSRRIMWEARDGKKSKSATLAGVTMALHPHSPPTDAINTLAAPYGNNHCLLTGVGSFGTRLDPTAYGAPRYTSVYASKFAEKVFYVDLELVPMKPNYDNTLEEPVHFLPLVPMCLVNPIEGIALGFACDIFPRALDDIIETQLKVLDGKGQRNEPNITFTPFNNVSKGQTPDGKWIFEGEVIVEDSATARVTNLPYGMKYENFISLLNKLIDNEKMVDYIDRSKDNINIECKFKRGELLGDNVVERVKDLLGLKKTMAENINLIDFDGKRVISPTYFEIVEMFTKWRLTYYKKRYERLAAILEVDIQKLRDILTAIKHNVGGEALKKKGKQELKEFLTQLKIVHIDYIASLPVYRFTKEEKDKVEAELKESLLTLEMYQEIIEKEQLQIDLYKQELKQIRKEFC